MAFIRHKGHRPKFMWLPVTPSTAFTANTLVTFTSGKLVPAVAATAAADIVGIIRHSIASTDSDYALDRRVEVEVPTERHMVYLADTASAVAGDIGKEVDLTDAGTVNRGATTIKAVRIVGLLSATKVYVMIKFNGAY